MFEGSGSAYLDQSRVSACKADRGELRPQDGVGWIVGLDPAFSSDPFGVAVVGRSREDRDCLVLGAVRVWSPTRSSSFDERRQVEDKVLDEVAELCLSFQAPAVTDQYAARPLTDALRRRGVYVRSRPMTATSKTEIFSALRSRINDGSVELYEHPGLLAELRRLRTKYAAGHASVVNPRVGGSHGDMAQALALAVGEHDRFGRRRGDTAVAVGIQPSLREILGERRNPGSELPVDVADALYGPIGIEASF
jgi:hypothetical protein